MIEITQRDAVNEAIVAVLQSGCDKASQEEIHLAYGADVAAQVRAVYDAAMDAPVDWKTSNMDAALGVLADYLATEFPWLSAPARTRLNYCYIMAWK